MSKHYTEKQIDWIKSNQYGRDRTELTQEFNAVFGTDKTMRSMTNFCSRQGFKGGYPDNNAGRWKKGTLPWCTGLKRPMHRNSGMFEKGNGNPHRILPIGARTVFKDGIVYIKTANPDVWEKEKKVIWRQHYGDIPPRHVILHIDGDSTNTAIENLRLLSRSEMIYMIKTFPDKTIDVERDVCVTLSKLAIKVMKLEKGVLNAS